MKIVLSGGGTGGHLNVVQCLLESAVKKNISCIYIGSEQGQDRAWFENETRFEKKFFLPSSAVVNQKALKKIQKIFQILKLALQCKKILKQEQIQAVFSVGGYSAAPASFAAILNHTPLYIHEQNSKTGTLNALLKPFAKAYFSAFEPIFCPYPVKEVFNKHSRLRKELKSIIFLGGSQGASFINDLALNLALNLQQKGIKIIHQSGKKDFEKCQKFYEKHKIKAELFAFDSKLYLRMQKADLAISRAGASTLFELCTNALPTLFIPYKYASKNHQYFNAQFLLEQGLCELFTEEQAQNEALLLKTILTLNLQSLSEKLLNFNTKNGADFILEYALKKSDFKS